MATVPGVVRCLRDYSLLLGRRVPREHRHWREMATSADAGGVTGGPVALMDWRLKVGCTWAAGILSPGGQLNYLLQRHVTHSVPVPDTSLESSVAMARRHPGPV